MRTRLVLPIILVPLFLGLILCTTSTMARETNSASGPKIETGFAEVNSTRLYYEVAGTGDPIVLIHGNFGDRRYFDGQFDALARHHRVLRYDVRGYGKSMTTSRRWVSRVGQRLAHHRLRTYTPGAVGGSGKYWDSTPRDTRPISNVRYWPNAATGLALDSRAGNDP